jgi:hypothetical protein
VVVTKLRGALISAALGLVALAASHAQALTITASGTIYSDGVHTGNLAGLFVTPGASMIGYSYTETITTDPLLNGASACSTISCLGTIGGPFFGGPGAPYTITTTINGISYTQTEANPFVNEFYLIDALSVDDTSTTLQDQAYQGVASQGCVLANGPCTNSYILAYSLNTPFVPSLDFNQSITVLNGLDPGSNTYFSFREGPADPGSVNQYSEFYGSISALTINVPEPSSLAVLIGALAAFGVMAGRKRAYPNQVTVATR